jgi:hypothetical protein
LRFALAGRQQSSAVEADRKAVPAGGPGLLDRGWRQNVKISRKRSAAGAGDA